MDECTCVNLRADLPATLGRALDGEYLKMFKDILVAMSLLALTPAAAMAASTVNVSGLGEPGSDYTDYSVAEEIGYAFTLNQDVTIAGLGFYAATVNGELAAQSWVSLWNASGDLVAEALVNNLTAGAWNWGDLTTVNDSNLMENGDTLTAGEYRVSYTALGAGGVGTSYALIDNIDPAAYLTVTGAVYNASQGDYPGSTPITTAVWLADILVVTDVPAPAALPLAIAGFGGLALLGRRKKAA